MAQAAEWAPLTYARAIKEWPWIGVISYWYFKPADEHNKGDSSYYFRMVEPDFTPTPIYEALKAYITGEQPKALGAGRHGTQNHGVTGQSPDGRETRTFRIDGTGVYLCADDPPHTLTVAVHIDGRTDTRTMQAGSTACVALRDSLGSGEHLVTLAVDDWTSLDSIVVVDDTARQRLPWLLAGIVAGALAAIVLGYALYVRLGRPPL
jgi:hypothetical protein